MEWVLATLLIITQLFWMYSHHVLVNKLMSGNYATYSQAQKALKSKPREPKREGPPVDDKDIQMLNQMAQGIRI